MLIVSSVFPSHTNREAQVAAVKSWGQFGECYSFNAASEIEQVKDTYDSITFIETGRTMEKLLGKPLVNLNVFFDFAKERNEELLIINSDILIDNLPEFKQDGITILSRWDYSYNYVASVMFEYGFDLFYIPKHLLNFYPPSIYGLGSTWTDYSIPYRAILDGIPVYWPQGRYIFHKIHIQHWNYEEWQYTFQYFSWEFKLDRSLTAEAVNVKILSEIKSRAIKTV